MKLLAFVKDSVENVNLTLIWGIKISHLKCLQLLRGFVPMPIYAGGAVFTEQSSYKILKELRIITGQ